MGFLKEEQLLWEYKQLVKSSEPFQEAGMSGWHL